MNFFPSSDEEDLRVAAERYIQESLPLTAARAGNDGARSGLAEMGFFAITLAEEAGGLGLDHAAELLVFAEMGRALGPIGAIASAIAARVAAATGDADLAGQIARGRGVALGLPTADRTLRLLDPIGADIALVVEAEGADLLSITAPNDVAESIDRTTRLAVIERAAATPLLREAGPRALGHLRILASAYSLGAIEGSRDMGAAYAATRVQFGRPIGSFQGIKHPCADMQVRSSVVRAQLSYAACAIDEDHPDKDFHVMAARKLASSGAMENGRMLIQIHGGMGMTDECDAHLFLKRAHLLQFLAPADRAALLVPISD
jgi:alkylation response protein AidB-like acyl-CoA dehydrogenase